jgi:hypothetical protein
MNGSWGEESVIVEDGELLAMGEDRVLLEDGVCDDGSWRSRRSILFIEAY